MSTNNRITEFQDAATARWLSRTLASAQRRNEEVPSDEAVDRIRARVFGEPEGSRARRSIAA